MASLVIQHEVEAHKTRASQRCRNRSGRLVHFRMFDKPDDRACAGRFWVDSFGCEARACKNAPIPGRHASKGWMSGREGLYNDFVI
jgi:hypothetical protein